MNAEGTRSTGSLLQLIVGEAVMVVADGADSLVAYDLALTEHSAYIAIACESKPVKVNSLLPASAARSQLSVGCLH